MQTLPAETVSGRTEYGLRHLLRKIGSFRYSLRALLVLAAVLPPIAGWLKHQRDESRRAARLVELVASLLEKRTLENVDPEWEPRWPFRNTWKFKRFWLRKSRFTPDDVRTLRQNFPGVPISYVEQANSASP